MLFIVSINFYMFFIANERETNDTKKSKLHRKGDFFLFSLLQKFKILGVKGPNKNYMYYYKAPPSKATNSHSQLDQGIGFGGQLGFFRLHIDNDLSNVVFHTFGTTYESGSLFESTKTEVRCEIDVLEVFGVGEADALQRQLASKKRDDKLAMQNRLSTKKNSLPP